MTEIVNVPYNVHMNNINTLSLTEARKQLFELAKNVQQPAVYYTFTAKGRDSVVMLSADEFASWMETFEVLKDFPQLDQDLAELAHDTATGKVKHYTPLQDLISSPHVHRHTQTKRRKKLAQVAV